MPAPPSAAPGYYPPPLAPPIYNWAGFYFGGNAGGAWTMSTGPVNSTQTSGFIGGGQVGYNFLLPPSVLLGVEADFDGLTNTNSSIAPDGIVQHDAKLNFLSTVRGRVGLNVDRLLVYGTGGVAFTQSDVTRTQLATAGASGGYRRPIDEHPHRLDGGWRLGIRFRSQLDGEGGIRSPTWDLSRIHSQMPVSPTGPLISTSTRCARE